MVLFMVSVPSTASICSSVRSSKPCAAEIVDHHLGTALGQMQAVVAAQAIAAASDHCHAAVVSNRHVVSLKISSAACQAMAIMGPLVLPEIIVGVTERSITP